MSAETRIPRVAKGHRPQYFQDPATDKLLSMVFTLAGELSVNRQRLDALERILETRDVVRQTDIDNYEPADETVTDEREKMRQQLVDRLLSIVAAELQEYDETRRPTREAIVSMLESLE